jgi:hypothetical protein
MEDFYEARIDDVDREKVGMFGVYDGMYCLVISSDINSFGFPNASTL